MRIKTRKRIETYLFRFFQYASDNNCRYRNLKAVIFHLLEATCNFDVSLCGFVQGTDDKFDWTRHKGNTSSSGTGPSFDHTTGNMTGELEICDRAVKSRNLLYGGSTTISKEKYNMY